MLKTIVFGVIKIETNKTTSIKSNISIYKKKEEKKYKKPVDRRLNSERFNKIEQCTEANETSQKIHKINQCLQLLAKNNC